MKATNRCIVTFVFCKKYVTFAIVLSFIILERTMECQYNYVTIVIVQILIAIYIVFLFEKNKNTSHSRLLDSEADDGIQTKYLQLRPEQESVEKMKYRGN